MGGHPYGKGSPQTQIQAKTPKIRKHKPKNPKAPPNPRA